MNNTLTQSRATAAPGPARYSASFAPRAARPTHEAIAALAYDIYISTGHAEGRAEQNWLQAEQDLTRRSGAVFEAKQYMDELSKRQ